MTSDKLIYKYFSFTAEALDSLRKNYIWLSKPSDFNDPFDCYPDLLRFKLTKENYSKMIESNLSLEEFPITVHTSLTQEEENRLNGILRKETKKIYQNFGICCFSKKHDDILSGHTIQTNIKDFALALIVLTTLKHLRQCL